MRINSFNYFVAATFLFFLSFNGEVTKACFSNKPANQKEPKKTKDNGLGTVIGIDLGTSYSCVGVFRNGRVDIIANDQGNRITPSYVAFNIEGERLIGDAAKNHLTSNPANTIFDVKRFIGREHSDPEVQHDIKYFPFKVLEKNSRPHVRVQTFKGVKDFSAQEISSMVLMKMKQQAEAYLGHEVTHAVITVPAYFNDAQRQATKDAGTIAGLNVLRLINEPTAAAIAYGINEKKGERNILVYDLGGGTFDVSLLNLDNGVFEVLATNGNTHLGGEDFDKRVMEHFIKTYKKKKGIDLAKDNRAVQKLRREVEKAKRALSSELQVTLEVESLYDGQDFKETLTRVKFEELNSDLFHSTLKVIDDVLKATYCASDQTCAEISKKDVDEILLVGGSTRIPKIRELVKNHFDGKEPVVGVSPDEAVARGAAIQGGILSGESGASDILLMDINPLTLGIETLGGVMSKIIPRNTLLPTRHSEMYSTVEDNQDAVDIRVFEGERAKAEENLPLDNFRLTGIPLAPRGYPEIEVTFEIDANGILDVSATDKQTNNREKISIKRDKNRLSSHDIEQMIKEAKVFSDADEIFRSRVQSRNELEELAYSIKNQVNDEQKLGSKISDDDKGKIEAIANEKIFWLENFPDASVQHIIKQKKELEDAIHLNISKIFKQSFEESEDWLDEFYKDEF